MVISTPILIGSASNFNVAAPTTLATTINRATNGGHVLIVCGGNRSSTVAITDPRGNTVSNDVNTASGSNTQFSIHSIPIVINYQSGDSFTATWSVGNPNRFIAIIYMTNLNALDTVAQASGASTSWASGAINTSFPYEFLLGGAVDNSSVQTSSTPLSPWKELFDTNTSDSVNFVVQYQMVAKTGSFNCQGTWAAGTVLGRAGVAGYSAIPSGTPEKSLRPHPFSPGLAR